MADRRGYGVHGDSWRSDLFEQEERLYRGCNTIRLGSQRRQGTDEILRLVLRDSIGEQRDTRVTYFTNRGFSSYECRSVRPINTGPAASLALQGSVFFLSGGRGDLFKASSDI